ncbi:MAG: tetratricopeptide repeat protein [Alphaproteobacteria bacterium]|nr:tetratricopeptide repeat protein [Alphaproteobacteria bacterium]
MRNTNPGLCLALGFLIATAITLSPGLSVEPAAAQVLNLARAADNAADEGDFDKALQLYEQAIVTGELTQHNLAAVHFNRGALHMQMANPADAVRDFTQTVLLRPDHNRAWTARGIALRILGDAENAVADFTQALEVGGTEKSALYNLRGQAYKDLLDFRAAIDDYDTALELRPHWAFATRNRGRAKFYLGEFHEAAIDLDAAYDLAKDPYTSIWRFLSIARLGRVDEALRKLERDNRRLRDDLWPAPVVRMYLGTETPDRVLETTFDPDDPQNSAEIASEAMFYIGQLFLLRGDEKEAEAFFDRVLSLGVNNFFEYDGARAELARLR